MTEKIGRGRPEGTTTERQRHLNADELSDFMRSLDKEPLATQVLMRLSYWYGLRVGEAVTLTIADVNLPAKQITIRRLKGGAGRAYDIPDDLLAPLLRSVKESREAKTRWLFPSHRRTRPGADDHISAQTAKNYFKNICRNAGLERPHSHHDLRHTCAMNHARHSDSMTNLAAWLGHQRTETSQTYIKAARDAALEAEMTRKLAHTLRGNRTLKARTA